MQIKPPVALSFSLFFSMLCMALLLFVGLTDSYSSSYKEPGLSVKEKSWLNDHPVIRLAPDPDFPPIEFLDKQGVYRGIAADFIHLLEKKIPLKFEIVSLKNWDEVIAQAKARQIDMMGAAVPTPERLKYMRFTRPYVEFPAVVLVRDTAVDFPNLSELKGKSVAVVSNYADHDYMLRAYPDIPLEVMPDISSGLRQVSFGKIDAMVLNIASAAYYIQKDGINNLQVTQDTDFVFDLSFAARGDWPILTSILEKGMAAITPEEKKAVLDNWVSLGNKSWKPSPLFLISATSIFLLLILFCIIFWNRSLQRQVTERTIELETELGERIQAEREKEKLQLEIHRAKKMEAVGVLAGGVAHDLNNILSGTVGYSDLALRKISDDSPIKKYLEEIRESGRRAAAVVDDLLTISRDAASERHTLSLNTIISEYLSSPEHQALVVRFPDIKFLSNFEPDLHNLSCSETHIRKCIMNLVINAAEAASKGTVTIGTANKEINMTLKYYGSEIKPGSYVLLSVADTGTGIAPEDLEHIFEPFYSKKKFGRSGTGLGLAVVWNAVQEHQGFIEVKQPAEGSLFELNFPATGREICGLTVPQDGIEIEGCGEHILVIDDEGSIRTLAEKLLINLGYKVSLVSSGEEAVEFLRNCSVDLLLLDMIMEPGMNGYQTFKKIKETHPQQKALIASGFSESHNVKKAQELGAGAYLKKPYTLQELGLAVKKALTD
ncbi:MAG: transporter substrate-binding domain-containing protein [Desulfuromusa sp.]|nr:transporter substrate-binding domain-containing protein [Desulfuromusa sp.]